MHFLMLLKIVSLLSVTNSLILTDTDLKFKKLEDCLLRGAVEKEDIIHRDMDGYSEVNWQWNSLNGNVKPIAYLRASKVKDVQRAVLCCRVHKIRIVPKSGGHSYVKNGFGDFKSLIVDVRKLNTFVFHTKEMTVEIGSGAQNGLVNYKLSSRKLLLPVGICPSVGIGGLALGGGWGYFSRTYGLTTDHIIGLQMVDARGKALIINNSTNADLFFALRGGGGGNYGIVTSFKFKVYPAPHNIVFGSYEFDFLSDFLLFYQAYQDLITKTPNNIASICHFKGFRIVLEIYYINENAKRRGPKELEYFMNNYNFPKPSHSNITAFPYNKFLLKISQYYSNEELVRTSQLASITKEINDGWKKVKSFYVTKMLNEKEIHQLYILLEEYLKQSTLVLLQNGGAMNMVSRKESAFIHRKHLYDVQMQIYNLKSDAAAKVFFEGTKKILDHRESYQNYLDQDMPDFLERYYGEQLPKLVQIKNKYDPLNQFHHPQSIPTKI